MIDRGYYVKVADLMKLPRPRRVYKDSTGDVLPLVHVECELWSHLTWW